MIKIVTVNNKKWAQFEHTKQNKAVTKNMVLMYGGSRYLYNGTIIYRMCGVYGNLEQAYQELFDRASQ